VQGVFTYDGGRLTFERFSAWHAREDGLQRHVQFSARRRLQLVSIALVDRLRMDRQFMQACRATQEGSGELNTTGPMSLQGSIVLAAGKSGRADDHATDPARQGCRALPADTGAEPKTVSQWNLNVAEPGGGRFGVRWKTSTAMSAFPLDRWNPFQMRVNWPSIPDLPDHQFTQVLDRSGSTTRGPFRLAGGARDNQVLPRASRLPLCGP